MSWECKNNGGIISFTSPPLFSLSTAGDGGTEVFVAPPPWFSLQPGEICVGAGLVGLQLPVQGT